MRIVIVLAVVTLLLPGMTHGAGPAKVGDRVELKATHHQGVPLHQESGGTHDFQRVPDGTTATVTETAQDGRWLKLQLPDGNTGWITAKYVARVITGDHPPPLPPPETDAERRVWGSLEGCQQVVAAGGRMPKDNPEALRLGTWNIRWFPRGCHPEEDCPENVTDISWLACTIAWMNVDLLAIQEILTSQSAQTAMNTLRTELDHLTGGSWQVDLQKCGGATSQHVGYLWNSHRITLERQVDVPALNGASPGSPTTACAARLRPGRYAHAKTNAAVDFHIISVHLDSGTANRDYQNRRTATGRIGDVEIDGTPLSASDRDIIVLGDYNTMGRKEPPPISSQEEIATLDQDLAPGFRRRPETPACTEYSDNKAGTLDHVVVSAGMQEAAAAAARVTGYLCGRAVHGGLEYDAGSLRTALRPLPGCV